MNVALEIFSPTLQSWGLHQNSHHEQLGPVDLFCACICFIQLIHFIQSIHFIQLIHFIQSINFVQLIHFIQSIHFVQLIHSLVDSFR